MRKLIEGNYNVICKGKGGQLIESSPSPERCAGGGSPSHPLIGIVHIRANVVYGLASDGNHIYFSTRAYYSYGNVRKTECRLYKYSIVGGQRIWTVVLDIPWSAAPRYQIFILGNYIYYQRSSGSIQRYSKNDGSKYGAELGAPIDFRNANYFVDGNYLYAWYESEKLQHLRKFDSNLNQVSDVLCEPISIPGYTEYDMRYGRSFILGWDGSHLCGGYTTEYRGPEDAYLWRSAWAKWSLSGGPAVSAWTYGHDWTWEYLSSGCEFMRWGSPYRNRTVGANIIIGDKIWSFGKLYDVLSPDQWDASKNYAMYHNLNWRQTDYYPESPHPDSPYFATGSFYGEGKGNYTVKGIEYKNKFYYVCDSVGVNEFTKDGVWQNFHIV